MKKTAPVLLALMIVLAGCSAAPEDTNPVVPVDAATWDPAQYPERVAQDDYLGFVSAQYDVWSAGEAWRLSGAGYDPKSTVRITLVSVPADGSMTGFEEELVGAEVETVTNEFGQFATAYQVPEDTKPGSYRLTVSGPTPQGGDIPITVVQ